MKKVVILFLLLLLVVGCTSQWADYYDEGPLWEDTIRDVPWDD